MPAPRSYRGRLVEHFPGCTGTYPEKPEGELPRAISRIDLDDDSGEFLFQCVDCGAVSAIFREGHPMVVWTIYLHPRDFEQFVVVRPSFLEGGRAVAYHVGALHRSLTDARECLADLGAQPLLPRDPTDDPVVVETWLTVHDRAFWPPQPIIERV